MLAPVLVSPCPSRYHPANRHTNMILNMHAWNHGWMRIRNFFRIILSGKRCNRLPRVNWTRSNRDYAKTLLIFYWEIGKLLIYSNMNFFSHPFLCSQLINAVQKSNQTSGRFMVSVTCKSRKWHRIIIANSWWYTGWFIKRWIGGNNTGQVIMLFLIIKFVVINISYLYIFMHTWW